MRLLVSRRRKVVITITSLIDVVLLLLIFFMLTSSFVEQPGMKLDLPESKTAQSEKTADPEIRIISDGTIYFDSKITSMEELEGELELLKTNSAITGIVIKADKTVSHGTVVKIMDIARINGLQKITIASDIED